MNWAYITGFFDGEGSIVFYRKKTGSNLIYPIMCFTNANRKVLEEIHQFVKCGGISVDHYADEFRNHKQTFRLQIAKFSKLRELASQMLPHSIVKQEKLTQLLQVLNEPRLDGRRKA